MCRIRETGRKVRLKKVVQATFVSSAWWPKVCGCSPGLLAAYFHMNTTRMASVKMKKNPVMARMR